MKGCCAESWGQCKNIREPEFMPANIRGCWLSKGGLIDLTSKYSELCNGYNQHIIHDRDVKKSQQELDTNSCQHKKYEQKLACNWDFFK